MRAKKLEEIRNRIYPILKRYDVARASIFGSYVRDEETPKSDIDILVDIKTDISLLDFVGLKQEIEDALGRKVDLVEYDTLKPLLREKILKEQVVLL